MYLYTYLCTCICKCTYISIHVYTHIYVYIYMYTYTYIVIASMCFRTSPFKTINAYVSCSFCSVPYSSMPAHIKWWSPEELGPVWRIRK